MFTRRVATVFCILLLACSAREDVNHAELAAKMYNNLPFRKPTGGEMAMAAYSSRSVGDFRELVSTTLVTASKATGGLIGSAHGFWGGAAAGAALSGPVGALVGGVVGAFAGGKLGTWAGGVVGRLLSKLTDVIVDFFRRLFGYDGCCAALRELELPCGMMYYPSEAKIRKAYRHASMQHHPDKHHTGESKDEAHAKMIQINAAFQKAVQCVPSSVDSWTDSVNEWVGHAGSFLSNLAAGQWTEDLSKQALNFLGTKTYDEQMFDHVCSLLEKNKPDSAKRWWDPLWTTVRYLRFGTKRCDL